MIWSVRPFVRILIFFVTGILIARYVPAINSFSTSIYLIISSILLLVTITLTLIKVVHRYSWVTGFIIGVLITILGIIFASQKTTAGAENPIIQSHTWLGNIISNPTETKRAVKAIVRVSKVKADSNQNYNPKKILCFFTKDSLSTKLQYGDLITFNAKLSRPNGPLNPGEFDYAQYLKHEGIIYTTFINGGSWKLINYDPSNPIIAIAGKLRLRLLHLLRKNGLSEDNYAVAAAILLGYDDYMENSLKQDYIMAGAMHILCVSGLHVGIIYLVINFLLSFLRNNRTNNILKAILLLITIWAYATITGLSPSVQRASLMLTVFIFGNLLNRNRDTYNTLAISALILLLIDPYLVYNVGFQLSYAAVIGIITFHQPLYKLLYIKNVVVDKIWSITVLAFSAQLATFPIATHYFHFFPPWFWLTNLFTFPLSFLIIATGLAFVLTVWIPVVPQLIGWILSGMIYLLNIVVSMVKHLPLSGIDNIYTSLPMIALLYLTIILTFTMFVKKKLNLLIVNILLVAIIMGLNTYYKYSILSQKRIVIYSINKHSAWDFIDGKRHVLLTDSLLSKDKEKANYHLKNCRTQWATDDIIQTIPRDDTIINNILHAKGNLLFFNDIRIFIDNGSEQYYTSNSKLAIDMIIISGRKSTDIEHLLSVFATKRIVIDSSVPWWKQKKITEVSNKQGISCYNVNKDGALIINL